MNNPRSGRHIVAIVAAGLVLAACGGTDTGATGPAGPTEQAPDTAASATAPTEQAPDTAASAAAPATDVAAIRATTADGATISPADFAGQPVFVETFATWCSNCRSQLGSTQEAAAQAGDDAVFLALSVETNLDPAALAGYAEDNGFADIQFAVLEPEALVDLEAQFGNAVLVPPATPKFRIDDDGGVSELTTGFESVEEILAQLPA